MFIYDFLTFYKIKRSIMLFKLLLNHQKIMLLENQKNKV